MILSVSHVTTYRYETPLRAAVQSLRLTPANFDGQRVVKWKIAVEGGSMGAGFRDGAGDWIESWSVPGPISEIRVSVVGEVVTNDMAGVLRGHREVCAPEAYLRETHPTHADVQVIELAREAVGRATDGLDRAHRLSAAVSAAIAYQPGATEAHTTAAEALALGEGVCQDHAHALIAAARSLDLPARYVSGYLLADLEGRSHEAAHAWAEIWVEGLGWIGFDPANGCCPDARYIRLGSGFDAQDAAPIRGVGQGLAPESLDVAVAVEAVQQ